MANGGHIRDRASTLSMRLAGVCTSGKNTRRCERRDTEKSDRLPSKLKRVAQYPAPQPNPVLEALDIRKSYGGVHALRGVSLSLLPGEVHALVGENGAGKSTLIKVLTGAVQPDAGEIRIRGQQIQRNSPAISRSLGIAVIYQQPALFPDLTVAENIALANDSVHLWHKVDWKGRRAHAAQLLERTGARIRPDASVSSLSMPEQQLVE